MAADARAVSSEQLVEVIAELADDKKAIDIVELDVRGVVGYTDYFVICSGNTERQVKAIHDGIHQGLKDDHGMLPRRVEGLTRVALGPHGLPRRRRPRLHARGARLLPPRAALGRGPGAGGRHRAEARAPGGICLLVERLRADLNSASARSS